MNDQPQDWRTAAAELTEEQKHANAIRFAFDGDAQRFQQFVETLAADLPDQTAAGLGTSDLDLTLVGGELLEHFVLTGFYVPGVHTRPLNDETLDIAPELVPLREKLMEITRGRPVNIQATRDFYVWIREHWLGQ